MADLDKIRNMRHFLLSFYFPKDEGDNKYNKN